MRVLIVAEFLDGLGGCENLCVHVAAFLALGGDDVLVAFRSATIHPRWRAVLSEVQTVLVTDDDPVGHIEAIVFSFRPDVIHAIPYERTIFEVLERGISTPVVGTEPCDGSPRCGWWFSGDRLQAVLPLFDGVHVLSRRAAQHLRDEYGFRGRTAVILPPAAFDPGWGLWADREHAFRLFYAGRLATEKGVEVLIAAIARIREAVAPVTLDIWGTGPESAYLKRLAVVSGGASWIMFRRGFRSFEAIPFQEYDALVMPSWFEGMPYVFLEALWCGVPAVVSINGGMRELTGVESLAHFFDPARQETLIAALKSLFAKDRKDASAPVRRRRLVAEQCAPSMVIERYRDFYRDVITGR